MIEVLPIVQHEIGEKHVRFARYAKALGHPIRIFIVEFCLRRNCCYSGDLAELLPIARSTLSQHLSELKSAGLIQGEINPPRIKYCINREAWDEAKALFGDLITL
ncbi:MAG: helix-turn-helix domain-containing protein [Bacteroidia bacterium]|nr:helix-turn-helix domain-containing protein [Bacteroidia bacterium]